MVSIPVRLTRTSFSGLTPNPDVWYITVFQFAEQLYAGAYDPDDPPAPTTPDQWIARSPFTGSPAPLVSPAAPVASPYDVAPPTVTGTPLTVDVTLEYPDGETYHGIDFLPEYRKNLTSSHFVWGGLQNLEPVVAAVAEITRDGEDYTFAAVARAHQYPLHSSETNPITLFEWSFNGTTVTTTDISLEQNSGSSGYFYRAAPVDFTLSDPENATIKVRATSEYGQVSRWARVVLAPIPEAEPEEILFGSLIDAAGILYSAVNSAESVQVSRFKAGAGSRELLAVIADAKNASMHKDRRGQIHITYTSRSGENAAQIRSLDSGASVL